jgi:protein-disulfide isomerase
MTAKLRIILIVLLTALASRTVAQTSPSGGAKPETKRPSSSVEKPATIETRVEKYLRNLYAWGPEYEVKVGTIKPSPIPDLLEVPVSVSMAGQGDTAVVYVNKNGTFLIRGELADMSADPFAGIRSKLHPENSPSMGPENAKVTLIEFADFECPSCRQLDRILRDYMPNHPEIRLVFKHFPLTEIHPWAMTAAIASQCTYEQNPAAFWKMHDAIFDAQDAISTANVKEKMEDLANKQALNLDSFKTCMSNPEIAQQVEQTKGQGRSVNITGTPTTFVNGRTVMGADGLLLEQFVKFEESRN